MNQDYERLFRDSLPGRAIIHGKHHACLPIATPRDWQAKLKADIIANLIGPVARWGKGNRAVRRLTRAGFNLIPEQMHSDVYWSELHRLESLNPSLD